jgi:Domain of unknown function (DUF4760)
LTGDRDYWEAAGKAAPVITAIIALCAAVIAWRAIYAQRDVARRRAAIDFFLRTETDEKLITLYTRFLDLNAAHRLITTGEAYKSFKACKQDYGDTRSFLNLLELIAVGVNRKAFSNVISYDYWADVLIDGWEDCRSLISFVRADEGEGYPETYCEIEKLHAKWRRQAEKARRRKARSRNESLSRLSQNCG